MSVQIKVYLNRTTFLNNKVAYCRCVDVPKGIDFPFSSVLAVMRLLYGIDSVIIFEV